MSSTRPIFGLILLLSNSVCTAAAAVRLEGGDGHLAARTDESSPWRLMGMADEIAQTSLLRTSPVGVVQLAIPEGTVWLCADTDAELNVAARRIRLLRGKLRLVINDDSKNDWTVLAARDALTCPATTEVAVATDVERPEVHLLKGTIRLFRESQPAGTATAPVANVFRPKVAPAPDEEQVKVWSQKIRVATSPRPSQGLGQLVTNDAQSGSQVRLEVARYHVNVVMKPPVALVQIDQSFFNSHGGQQEGTFVFNLPPGASVSRFAMFVTHENLIEGELIDRRRANQVYTSIVTSRRDPAILEQIGDNLFRMRVFPIPARDTKRILLDFTLPLVAEHDQYRFDLPLMSDLRPIWDFSLRGTIHPPLAPQSASSPTHPNIRFTKGKDQAVTFESRGRQVQPPPMFSLTYAAPKDPKPSVRSFALPDQSHEYHVLTVPAALNPTAATPPVPKDLLLLVDTSGNARNLARSRLMVRTIIAGLRPADRVRLGCVDVDYRPLTEQWCAIGSPELQTGLKRLSEQFALGMNDLDLAVPKALAEFAGSPEDRRRAIVYIGDGPTAVDVTQLDRTPRKDNPNAVAAEFLAIHTGTSVKGREWLRQEAVRTNGGMLTTEGKRDPLAMLFEWSLTGLIPPAALNHVEIKGVDAQDLFHDEFWPHGREFHVYARSPRHASVQLSLAAAGKAARTFELSVKLTPGDEDIFTARSWAQQKLQSMLGEDTSQNSVLQNQVVQLCQEWSLMSPLTAFLVLENEADYQRWNIERKDRHRYWKPAGTLPQLPIPSPRPGEPVVQNEVPSFDLAIKKEAKRLLNVAERALNRDQPERAMEILSAIRDRVEPYDPMGFDDVRERVQNKLRPGQSLSLLRLWRPVADRCVPDLFPPASTLLLQFANGGMSNEFLENHPHARALLRTVTECPQEMQLDEFATFIELLTQVPVVVDKQALSDEGINIDSTLSLENLSGISVRSLMAESLEPIACICVPERHAFKITTMTKADEMRSTMVYPVNDLIQTSPMPQPHRLANPYLDVRETARRRIESRLNSIVSVDYLDTPLSVALKDIEEQIGSRIRIDKQSLNDEGINEDAQVSLRLPNVPARAVLKELLEPLALTTIIRNERLKVLTQTKADESMETRLYSAAGLVTENPNAPRGIWPGGRPGWQQFGNLNGFGGMMGGFGGTFGGMGMGGFGGMPMGGMGGLGGGMGGMGGSLGGAPFPNGPVVPVPAAPAASRFDEPIGLEPFDFTPTRIEATEEEPWSAIDEDEPLPVPVWASMRGDWAAVTNSIEEGTSGKWQQKDGEGGAISFFWPSLSLVVRQSEKAHHETETVLTQLRRQLDARALQQPIKPDSTDRNSVDFSTLMNIIEEVTSGKWTQKDGEGGTITPSAKANSLTIRQTSLVHEEIAMLFAQLRRARYVAASFPYRSSFEGIDDLNLFDRPTFTELPRNATTERPKPAAEVPRWLANRIVPATLNQRWKSVSSSGQTHEFTLQTDGRRLELALPDRVVRTEGVKAAVSYPGLTLVEIDAWGQAARRLADCALPWLPHRTNEELTEEFDITLVEEDDKMITLRFNFPDVPQTYLQPTYSKVTRLPVRWLAVAGNEEQFSLEFDQKAIIARDGQKKELERWELVADGPAKPIPALNEGWNKSLVIDVGATESLYTQARAAMQRGDYTEALQKLTAAVVERPDQPLLNFLLAWCAEFTGRPDSVSVRRTRAALTQVATSEAQDLIRLMTVGNFRAIGRSGMNELLLAIPADRRSADTWNELAEIARDGNQPELALTYINKALAIPTDATTQARWRMLQIELLLRSNQHELAEKMAQDMAFGEATDRQWIDIAELFARYGRHQRADQLFQKVLDRMKPTGILQAELLLRHADTQKGLRRWQLLLQAAEIVPAGYRDRTEYVERIVTEARTENDAATMKELADKTTNESIRTKLRIRQAQLLVDPQQAAQIVLDLHQAGQIAPHRFFWSIKVLDNAERYEDIVRIVEAELRKGRPQDVEIKTLLRIAYMNLGRETDARRAGTDLFNAPPPRRDPATQRNVVPQGGAGFF